MNQTTSLIRASILSLALTASCIGTVSAEPVKFEATISPKADYTLNFADDSKHLVRLVQREGKTSGAGFLAGATMLEIGMHDMLMAQNTANFMGYLVFTKTNGDILYLKYDARAQALADASGTQQLLASGSWEVAGATGQLKGTKGLGTFRMTVPSATERRWLFDGDLSLPPAY